VGGKYSTVTAVLSVASRCRYSRSSQSMNKPFQSFKRPSTAYGPEAAALHRVAADLWLVTAIALVAGIFLFGFEANLWHGASRRRGVVRRVRACAEATLEAQECFGSRAITLQRCFRGRSTSRDTISLWLVAFIILVYFLSVKYV